jgi:hypothetical protein
LAILSPILPVHPSLSVVVVGSQSAVLSPILPVHPSLSVVAARDTAEVCLEYNGANVCRSNTSNGYIYKQYVNSYLIPKEMGSFKHIIEQFKDPMINFFRSDNFFSMMVVYQNGSNN